MRIPLTEHSTRRWRIHEIAPDFELEDVWALPTPGGPDDFALLVSRVGEGRPEAGSGPIGRFIWAVRWKLGALLGWDRADTGVNGRVRSLRERLPADLRDAPRGPEFPHAPFEPLFHLHDEFAAELANATVHAIMHLGWIEDGNGGYHAQMAVLVKPNGMLGRLYMAAIKPFRYLFIYPPLMRKYARLWQEATDSRPDRSG